MLAKADSEIKRGGLQVADLLFNKATSLLLSKDKEKTCVNDRLTL